MHSRRGTLLDNCSELAHHEWQILGKQAVEPILPVLSTKLSFSFLGAEGGGDLFLYSGFTLSLSAMSLGGSSLRP